TGHIEGLRQCRRPHTAEHVEIDVAGLNSFKQEPDRVRMIFHVGHCGSLITRPLCSCISRQADDRVNESAAYHWLSEVCDSLDTAVPLREPSTYVGDRVRF